MIVYRFQDVEGRGPYRPGMSHRWADNDHGERNPPFFDEFGMGGIKRARPTEVIGCAFDSLDQARRWFRPTEVARMQALGYELVQMRVARILARSDRQLVFAHNRPLAECGQVIAAEEVFI